MILVCSCIRTDNRKESASTGSDDDREITAGRFSIEHTDSCTILTINSPWQGAEGVQQSYCLVKRGRGKEINFPGAEIIEVPVKNIICMSSTHLAMISALGEQGSITGLSGLNYAYDKSVRERIDSGLISEVGYDSGINSELIINLSPDLIMMYGIGSESAGYISRIAEIGFKIMYNADYLENDPLGKAEWIKVFGALYCREEKADSLFESIRAEYDSLKKIITAAELSDPSVLLGLPYRDTWFVSPGNSYVSNLISDAGGSYLWSDIRSDFSMPFSFEAVYIRSLEADFWLNAGSAGSKAEIEALDPRLNDIPCWISGNIYNNTKRMSPGGGNDYWESGTMNPHLILKDIASILHPELFRDHELVYYRKIE